MIYLRDIPGFLNCFFLKIKKSIILFLQFLRHYWKKCVIKIYFYQFCWHWNLIMAIVLNCQILCLITLFKGKCSLSITDFSNHTTFVNSKSCHFTFSMTCFVPSLIRRKKGLLLVQHDNIPKKKLT